MKLYQVIKFAKQKSIGEIVPDNGQITIYYIGYFEDRNEPLDSTYSSGKPRRLHLNQGCIISDLEISLEIIFYAEAIKYF